MLWPRRGPQFEPACALAEKQMPAHPGVFGESRAPVRALQFDDWGARSTNELLHCHEDRHGQCERHRDRHASRDDDKVDLEFSLELYAQLISQRIGRRDHLQEGRQ